MCLQHHLQLKVVFVFQRSSLRLTRRMAEKPKVFKASSEEDTCSGFEESVINRQMKAMVRFEEKYNCSIFHQTPQTLPLIINHIFFQKVDSPLRRGRKSAGLKVAMTFPTKKTGKKRPASEPLPQVKAENSDSEEEEENFINKRALNIKENKEMVQIAQFILHELLQL